MAEYRKDNVIILLDQYQGLYTVYIKSPSGQELRAYKKEANAEQYFTRLKYRYRFTQLKIM